MAKKHVNSRKIIDQIDRRCSTNSRKMAALHALICLHIDLDEDREVVESLFCASILAKEYDRLNKLFSCPD